MFDWVVVVVGLKCTLSNNWQWYFKKNVYSVLDRFQWTFYALLHKSVAFYEQTFIGRSHYSILFTSFFFVYSFQIFDLLFTFVDFVFLCVYGKYDSALHFG